MTAPAAWVRPTGIAPSNPDLKKPKRKPKKKRKQQNRREKKKQKKKQGAIQRAPPPAAIHPASGPPSPGITAARRPATPATHHPPIRAYPHPNALVALNRTRPKVSLVAFAFTINVAVRVRVTLAKLVRSHGRAHWQTLRHSLTIAVRRGRNNRRLRGQGALTPGLYRLTLTPAHGTARCARISDRLRSARETLPGLADWVTSAPAPSRRAVPSARPNRPARSRSRRRPARWRRTLRRRAAG